jgi:hypothetical protein
VLGLVGSSGQWRIVEDRWRRACGDIVFHGKEFFGRDEMGRRVGAYKDWSDAQARIFLTRLFDAIGGRLTLVGGLVQVPAFRALSLAERRYLTLAPFQVSGMGGAGAWRGTGAPSKPWFVGFASTLTGSAVSVKRHGMKVNFWFDRQNEYEGYANQMFRDATGPQGPELLRQKAGALVFEAKENYPGLQAADLMAFTCGSVNQRRGPKHAEQAYAVQRMQALGDRHQVLNWDERRMTRVLSQVDPAIKARWDTAQLRGLKQPKSR